MRVFIVSDTRRTRLAANMAAARQAATQGFHHRGGEGDPPILCRFVREDVQITEADLSSDKATLIDLINDGLPDVDSTQAYAWLTVLRRWELTQRGGLKLIADYREGA